MLHSTIIMWMYNSQRGTHTFKYPSLHDLNMLLLLVYNHRPGSLGAHVSGWEGTGQDCVHKTQLVKEAMYGGNVPTNIMATPSTSPAPKSGYSGSRWGSVVGQTL